MARSSEKTRSESQMESAPRSKAARAMGDQESGRREPGTPAAARPEDQPATAPSLALVSDVASPVLAGILPPASGLPVQSVKISQGVSGGSVDRRVEPIYPSQARRMRLEGRVVLEGVVTPQGSVEHLKVIEGNQVLARAAMNAVTQWHFNPYRLNGQPIQMTTDIVLTFKLP